MVVTAEQSAIMKQSRSDHLSVRTAASTFANKKLLARTSECYANKLLFMKFPSSWRAYLGENVISERLSIATIYGSGSMGWLTVGLIAIRRLRF
jgi:hypothetical protein